MTTTNDIFSMTGTDGLNHIVHGTTHKGLCGCNLTVFEKQNPLAPDCEKCRAILSATMPTRNDDTHTRRKLTAAQHEMLITLNNHSTYDFAFANRMRGWKNVANSLIKRGLARRGGDTNDLLFITAAGRAALGIAPEPREPLPFDGGADNIPRRPRWQIEGHQVDMPENIWREDFASDDRKEVEDEMERLYKLWVNVRFDIVDTQPPALTPDPNMPSIVLQPAPSADSDAARFDVLLTAYQLQYKRLNSGEYKQIGTLQHQLDRLDTAEKELCQFVERHADTIRRALAGGPSAALRVGDRAVVLAGYAAWRKEHDKEFPTLDVPDGAVVEISIVLEGECGVFYTSPISVLARYIPLRFLRRVDGRGVQR